MKKVYLVLSICCLSTLNILAQTCTIGLTSAVGTDAQTVCEGDPITDITYSVSGTSATVSILPLGINSTFIGGTLTISGASQVVGQHNYTVTASGGCSPDSFIVGSFTIHGASSIILTSVASSEDQFVCCGFSQITYDVSDSTTVTGLPEGNNWSYIAGKIKISGVPKTVGNYTYTVTTMGACPSVTRTGKMEVKECPDASFDYTTSPPYCKFSSNPAPVLESQTYPNIFSSSAGLIFVNDTTGEIDLKASTTGSYAITNTIMAGGGCPSASHSTFSIIIYSAFTYIKPSVCKGALPIQPAISSDSNGIFNATPAGLAIDSITGVIDPSASTLGTYTISYNSSDSCASIFVMKIIAFPDAHFNYAGPYTISTTPNPLPSFSNDAYAGIFTVNSGGLIFVDSLTGEIDLSLSSTGTYTVTNTIRASDGCPSVVESNIVNINPLECSLSLTSAIGTDTQTVCQGAPITSITYTITGRDATVTGLPSGVTGSFSAGVFTIAGNPKSDGNYTFTITTIGCSPQKTISGSIKVKSAPTITPNSSPSSAAVCEGNGITLTGSSPDIVTFVWTGGITDGLAFLPTSSQTYTVSGTNKEGCTGTAPKVISVLPTPKVGAVAQPSATICLGDSVILYATGASTYTWSDGISDGLPFRPSITNTYTVIGTSGFSCRDTATIKVTIKSLSSTGECEGFTTISGNVYQDDNNNCTLDSTIDQKMDNILLKLYDPQNKLIGQTFSQAGAYSFYIWDTAGTYTISINNSRYHSANCGTSNNNTVTLSSKNPPTEDVNFIRKCTFDYDNAIRSVFPRGRVFPGQKHALTINVGGYNSWFKLFCNNSISNSGTLKFTITGPVTFDKVYPGALTPSINGNEFTYTIADWSTIDSYNDFKLYFTTDTTAQSFDEICVHAEITNTISDFDSRNNAYDFCYRVRNSYDPNIKEVYPIDIEPGFEDWFNYTIHFQNTGNANAINIRLQDTLDANLELETFEVLGYSHPCTISLYDNLLTVFYPNIELPDSASNPDGSQGHVQYRIKPKAALPLGTKINNTALIYFDYNAAIVTNTTVNEYVKKLVSINENEEFIDLQLYPIPFNEILNVIVELPSKYTLSNIQGISLHEGILDAGENSIDTKSYPTGLYFISIENKKGRITKKIIKN